MEYEGVNYLALILFGIIFIVAFYGAGYHRLFFGRSIDWKLKKFNEKYSDLVKSGLLLIKDIPFFKALDERGKRLLIKNAIEIIKRVKMVNEKDRLLDLERSFQVSLVLAMVALGLEENAHFYGLKKIRVYEKPFYSKIVGSKVRGLSYATGFLGLSWEDFLYGFTTNEDRYNVGLHEAAHLLVICGYVNLNDKSDLWNIDCGNYIRDIKSNPTLDKGLFRDYAFTNLHEFWACSVEQFFEMPELFSQKHPRIYQLTKVKLGYKSNFI